MPVDWNSITARVTELEGRKQELEQLAGTVDSWHAVPHRKATILNKFRTVAELANELKAEMKTGHEELIADHGPDLGPWAGWAPYIVDSRQWLEDLAEYGLGVNKQLS